MLRGRITTRRNLCLKRPQKHCLSFVSGKALPRVGSGALDRVADPWVARRDRTGLVGAGSGIMA
jgi:hypothetical protein